MERKTYKVNNVEIKFDKPSDADYCISLYIGLWPDIVRELAYLGAAVVLSRMEDTGGTYLIPGMLPERWVKDIDRCVPKISYGDIEEFTLEDVIDGLLIWRGSYLDRNNNYDARLLQRAALLLQEQYDKIGELEDKIDEQNA